MNFNSIFFVHAKPASQINDQMFPKKAIPNKKNNRFGFLSTGDEQNVKAN